MASYRIFHPIEKHRFPKDIYLLSLSVLTSCFALFCFINPPVKSGLKLIVLLVCTASWMMLFLQWFVNDKTVDFRKGVFKGLLTLEKDRIICDDKTYLIKDIENISITNSDYKYKHQRCKIFGPRLSIGTKNVITLQLKNKTLVKAFFQQEHDNQIVASEQELISYFQEGILGKKNLINLIGSF
ncbi:hypothetical protein QW060_14615 [Myroides ceti]|jgi:hypothetical protein|uniref:Uncharacterized protein n=1 Tax=Paenimyroides ceti TaxID=395087 RepID=A0ABT8CV04_9FLAO|nr:hypothetical protein [Paenimyroides ceti]MDN3708334.1 hypothetical protein [Paenimyroides ceti]